MQMTMSCLCLLDYLANYYTLENSLVNTFSPFKRGDEANLNKYRGITLLGI